MKRSTVSLICFLFVALMTQTYRDALAGNPFPTFNVGAAIPDTSGQNGIWWLGGDAAYGTYFPGNQRSFWAFGDTYYSVPGSPITRTPNNILGNTIAIAQIDANGNFTPQYFYRGTKENPKPFFDTGNSNLRYWPQEAFFLDGTTLYVFLQLMRLGGDAPVPVGIDVARITNPTDFPWDWRIDYLHISAGDLSQNPVAQVKLNIGRAVLTNFASDSDSWLASQSADNILAYGIFQQPANPSTNTPLFHAPVVVMIPKDVLRYTANNTFIDPTNCKHLAQPSYMSFGRVWRNGLGGTNINNANQQLVPDYANTGLNYFSGYSIRYNYTLGKYQAITALRSGTAQNYDATANCSIPDAQYPLVPALTPCMLSSTSAAGMFDNLVNVGHTFGQLTTQPPASQTTACDKLAVYCYTIREWQINPLGYDDSTVVFTYTVGSYRVTNNLYGDLYYIGCNAAPNPVQ